METGKICPHSKPQCPVSDPTTNLHQLCRRSDPPLSICFSCKGQQHLESKRYYYYCASCDLEFHRGCHFIPPEIRHPFHLTHPLTLTFPDASYDDIPTNWSSSSSDPWYNSSEDDDYVSDANRQKCKSCEKNLAEAEPFYQCSNSTCNFFLHISCALRKPPLYIENPKSHHHTLTLFPRLTPLPCDACGLSLSTKHNQVYSCLPCTYFVHRSCIYLPRVIKITRHPSHRLSYTSFARPTSHPLPCGVCRRSVDINYGHYSCIKGCHYAIHSQCATNKLVWDGIDLEGVPEEEEEEVLEPFVQIDEETIQHFSHAHHYLRLDDGNHNHSNHETKFCQACTLPIPASDRFYSCNECDFVLDETCASFPRKISHPLHRHPLTLFHPFPPKPSNLRPAYYEKGYFFCSGCGRSACGFVYKCNEEDCRFQLDVRCASLPDPSTHELHDHLLFFNLTRGKCMGCQRIFCSNMYLECVECKIFLGLHCATLPRVAHYKHDKHPLTLCYGEEEATDLQYWCEICEMKLDETKWFYTCNSCQVTLHVKCLLGKEIYMKPDHTVSVYGEHTDIGYNKGNTRPVCDGCGRRCIYNLVLKWRNMNFCNRYCVGGWS